MMLQKINLNGLFFTVFLIVMTGCTSITNRSYSQPISYVKFAAQEACLTAGCELVPLPITNDSMQVKASRGLMLGLFTGQGGETIDIGLTDSGDATAVTITSRKRFFGFLAQRHSDERVAEFLDQYLRENTRFESMISEPASGVQP
jgi:hypothetical protein